MIVLKRFTYKRNFRKNNAFVAPEMLLTLKHMLKEEAEETYHLAAVAQHKGGVENGHYRALVKQNHNIWTIFDDEKVKTADDKVVLEPSKTWTHYMLFYKKNKQYF